MQAIHIRPATLADLPTLFKFEQGVIAAERPYDETLQAGPINYYDIQALIESPTSLVIVAALDKELVGSAYGSIRAAKPYLKHEYFTYLGFMYIKPNYRGRGINKQIIAALKGWSKSKGVTELRLNVYCDNQAAIRAYEKAGFQKHMINMRIGI